MGTIRNFNRNHGRLIRTAPRRPAYLRLSSRRVGRATHFRSLDSPLRQYLVPSGKGSTATHEQVSGTVAAYRAKCTTVVCIRIPRRLLDLRRSCMALSGNAVVLTCSEASMSSLPQRHFTVVSRLWVDHELGSGQPEQPKAGATSASPAAWKVGYRGAVFVVWILSQNANLD